MPRYNRETIQNVIDSTNIVDVVSEYVKLKKSGRSYMGCCPFHNEKTPSFSVVPEGQYFHCFGCGEGGDVIKFLMKIENETFVEALQTLADRAGITLPKTDSYNDEAYQKKLRLYEINRNLANHYYTLLNHIPEAQEYVKSRGIDQETRRTFGLGYAMNSWQDALNYLQKKGYAVSEILDDGIALRSDRGRVYDRFRDRLMIPIINHRGKIVGFGGRIMSDKQNEPKYLNSPETIIFSKGEVLFNLNNAKKHLESKQIIIVEGYMDVIALYQYGIKNVVAALGTAFTQNHGKLLSRYVDEIILCFDGDAAGEKATQRAISILSSSQLNIKVIRLDEKDDPDSYIRDNGVDAFQNRIEHAVTAVEYKLSVLEKSLNLETEDGRIKYARGAVKIIRNVKSPIERQIYAREAAHVSGVSEKMIFDAASQGAISDEQLTKKLQKEMSKQPNGMRKDVNEAQRKIIIGILSGRVDIENIHQDKFSDEFYKEIFLAAASLHKETGEISVPGILEQLSPENQSRLTALMAVNEEDSEASDYLIEESEKIMSMSTVKAQIARLKSELKENPNSDQADKLIGQIMELKKQLDTITVQEVEDV